MDYVDRKYTNLSSTETKTNQESTNLKCARSYPTVRSYPILPVSFLLVYATISRLGSSDDCSARNIHAIKSFQEIWEFLQRENDVITKNPAEMLLEFEKLVSKCIQTTFGRPSDPSSSSIGVAEDNQNVKSVPIQRSNELPKNGTSTATFTMRQQPVYTAVDDNEDNEEDAEDCISPPNIQYILDASEEGNSSTSIPLIHKVILSMS